MPKRVLLIESDAPFAETLQATLEGRGFAVRTTGDGKEGLELAQAERPDAIVLCVELPGTSGYSICNKLKKDEALRAIPLVVTSAEATPETFAQHRKLKTRAEDYLIKPFPPSELLERLRSLVGLPAPGDEEMVTLADVELEALGALEGGERPPVDHPEPPAAAEAPSLADDDEDLRLLDDAFDSIAAEGPKGEPGPRRDERAVDEEDAAAASGSLPDEEPPPGGVPPLAEEADAALAALESLPAADEALASPPRSPARASPPLRGASAAALRAAGIPMLDTPPPARPRGAEERRTAEGDADRARDRLAELTARAEAAEEEASQRSEELRNARAKIEALNATLKRLEKDLGASREGEKELGDRVASAERALSEGAARIEALERELDEARAEALAARGEAEGARGAVDQRGAELERRVRELEAANRKHEERVVKAYQKIKGDEKLREKARKALTIALQLLDEQGPGEEEKDARPAARD